MKRCYRGYLGSAFRAAGACILEYVATRALEETDAATVSAEEYLVALWGILYEDPLYELRIVAGRGGAVRDCVPGQLSPSAALAQRGHAFDFTPVRESPLERGGIFQEFEPAHLAVTSSTAYSAALPEATFPLGDYRPAVARPLIAEAVLRVQRSGGLQNSAPDARPRVILSDSLVGIACADLLLTEPSDIRLRVTVGSQARSLYEIIALQSLAHGAPRPAQLAKWLNVYDRRDLLSYKGKKISPGRATEVAADNRQLFPMSYTAYWENDDVRDAITKELP